MRDQAPTALSEETDEELMRRYVVEDSREAFEVLFQRYAGRLQAMFVRRVRSREVASDLLQQTFMNFHRARRDFQQGRLVRPWIYTIALNVRREYARQRLRKKEVALDFVTHGEPSVGPQTTSRSDRLVRRALGELTEQQREVIFLHWYEGLSFPEISTIVGASLSAVKVRAHRGYEALRGLLGDTEGNR